MNPIAVSDNRNHGLRVVELHMAISATARPYCRETSAFFYTPLKWVTEVLQMTVGKTIEAGIALFQYWTEGRRRLLVIGPAALRTQCALELAEKLTFPLLDLTPKYRVISERIDTSRLQIQQPCSCRFTAPARSEWA